MPRQQSRILSDQQKHDDVRSDQVKGEEDISGSMPATGSEEAEKPVVDGAHGMGVYEEASEAGEGTVEEVGIDKQVEIQEEKNRRGY